MARKGLVRAVGGLMLNPLLGRTFRHIRNKKPLNAHFVFTHPDDELAIYPQLGILSHSYRSNVEFTLFTNGTQGYEKEVHGKKFDRERFGHQRVKEWQDSMSMVGLSTSNTALIDERELYEALAERKFDVAAALGKKLIDRIIVYLESQKPDYVFVNDFAGGNIVHDIANYLVSRTVREMRPEAKVVEYWQSFLNSPSTDSEKARLALQNGKAFEVIGDLGYDSQGRILRGGMKDKYDLDIPQLGIKKGRAFNGLAGIIGAIIVKNEIYKTQSKSMSRLESVSRISHGLDAPKFRQIDVNKIDYTKKPAHGVMYEIADHRVRGLSRLPTFEDFKEFVIYCDKNLFRN